jgi:nicotinamidase-related amidase
MIRSRSLCRVVATVALLAVILAQAGGAGAQTVMEDWNKAAVPSPPPLKAVTIDSKTTALLMLDFLQQNCGSRPQCVSMLPAVKSLLTAARAKGALVVYTAYPPNQIPANVLPDVAPLGSEPTIIALADKFIDTNLDATLKAKGIKTVITVGAATNGAVLYTASDAAMRGYNVIVPVDCMSSGSTYADQFTTYQLVNAPTVANHVTLTRANMVTF